jgi:hypothetical protein
MTATAQFKSVIPGRNFSYHVALATSLWLAGDPKEGRMATLIVMDHNGDTRHNFDAEDAKALLKAEKRFKQLTRAGFTAATRTASGDPVVTRTFDPTAQETLFFPRLVGG